MWNYGPWMMGGGMGWPMLFGGGFWLLLILGVIVVVWAIRGGTAAHLHPPRRSPGLDALEERYARGEVPRDEYLQKKKDIAG